MHFAKTGAYVYFSFFFISTASLAAPENSRTRYTIDVVHGYEHTCAVSNDGKVKCWGSNEYSQLGIPDIRNAGKDPATMGSNLPLTDLGPNFNVSELCAGGYHTCALSTDHKVKCWGYNHLGQLGQGRNVYSVGKVRGQMGTDLPFTELGNDFKPEHISCGYHYSCAVSAEGSAKCWGDNKNGAIGLDPKTTLSRGQLADDMGSNLKVLPFNQPIKKIVTGVSTTCAQFVGHVSCWGNNIHGEVGIGSALQFVPIAIESKSYAVKLEESDVTTEIWDLYGGAFTFCAKYVVKDAVLARKISPSKLKCWGDNRTGQLGIGLNNDGVGREPETLGSKLPELQIGWSNWDDVRLHGDFTCALYQGAEKCWGRNDQGSLGLGDKRTRGKSLSDLGKNLSEVDLDLPVLKLSTGAVSTHSCALLINREVKCWGHGMFGYLGYENAETIGTQPRDMGSNLSFVRIW